MIPLAGLYICLAKYVKGSSNLRKFRDNFRLNVGRARENTTFRSGLFLDVFFVRMALGYQNKELSSLLRI